MLSTLLFLSFILHIIAFISIFQLFKKVQQHKKDPSDDIAALLKTYLNEIKKENRLLEEKTAKRRDDSNEELSLKKTKDELTAKKLSGNNPTVDIPEMSLQGKILQLHRKGIQTEEIAKMLNCGKTEAELIIKFYTKTDNNA